MTLPSRFVSSFRRSAGFAAREWTAASASAASARSTTPLLSRSTAFEPAAVADAVAVAVALRAVGDRRADVAGVADAVAVPVVLRGVRAPRAVVAAVAHAVAVDVARGRLLEADQERGPEVVGGEATRHLVERGQIDSYVNMPIRRREGEVSARPLFGAPSTQPCTRPVILQKKWPKPVMLREHVEIRADRRPGVPGERVLGPGREHVVAVDLARPRVRRLAPEPVEAEAVVEVRVRVLRRFAA